MQGLFFFPEGEQRLPFTTLSLKQHSGLMYPDTETDISYFFDIPHIYLKIFYPSPHHKNVPCEVFCGKVIPFSGGFP